MRDREINVIKNRGVDIIDMFYHPLSTVSEPHYKKKATI